MSKFSLIKNTTLEEAIEPKNELQKLLYNYTYEIFKPENKEINLNMIISLMAAQFPNLMLAISEESFIKGYEQAFVDIEVLKKEIKY